jgi:hypothetical protein
MSAKRIGQLEVGDVIPTPSILTFNWIGEFRVKEIKEVEKDTRFVMIKIQGPSGTKIKIARKESLVKSLFAGRFRSGE